MSTISPREIIYFLRALLIGLLCVLSICSLSGCFSERKTRVEEGIEKGILHIGNGDEPADLDPHVTTGVAAGHIHLALFEGLVSKSSQTLDVIPGVAESWTVSSDARQYKFLLRENARWSNGEALTAEDFVWSWRRALLPALGNQYAYSLFVIDNAEEFYRGEITDFNEVGVKAIDPRTLLVTLRNSTPYFLQLLDHHSFYPVHRATIEKFGREDQRGTSWTQEGNLVGNGPFQLKRWVVNSFISVEKNPHYWNRKDIALNEIHFYPINDPVAEERMFRAGQLHIIRQLPNEKVPHYQQAKTEQSQILRSFANFATYYYGFNTQRPPLDDLRVRKALAYVIDRQAITDNVLKAGQRPAYALTPPMAKGYVPKVKMPYDIEAAKSLLAEAGFPNGEGFPKLSLLYNTYDQHRKIAESIAGMWKQHLNIDVSLKHQDWKLFLAARRSGDFDIIRLSWSGDYYDPNTFLELFMTGSGNNSTGWTSSDYDALIASAATASTTLGRYEIFQEAEKMLIDSVPIIPLYTYWWNQLVHPSVKNWHNNIMDYYSYKHVHLAHPEPNSDL